MKSLLLFSLLSCPLARAEDPIHLSNYSGNFELSRQADGTFAFRTESFDGAGILDDAGNLDKGARYAVTGTLHCTFGSAPASVFECATRSGSNPKLHLQELGAVDGHVIKEADVKADYVSVTGHLVTTATVSGSYQQTVVESNVYGPTLNLDLSLSF